MSIISCLEKGTEFWELSLFPSAKERWGGACTIMSYSCSCHPETGMDTVPITLCYFLNMRQLLMLKNLVMFVTFSLPITDIVLLCIHCSLWCYIKGGVVNQKYYIKGISVHILSWHCVTVALYWYVTVLVIVLTCCHSVDFITVVRGMWRSTW